MARFDVHRLKGFDELVLDCQADPLNELPTRFVVPLLPRAVIGRLFARLNPVFAVDGSEYIMVTQSAGTVGVRELGERVTSLSEEQAAIMNALDMLLTGY